MVRRLWVLKFNLIIKCSQQSELRSKCWMRRFGPSWPQISFVFCRWPGSHLSPVPRSCSHRFRFFHPSSVLPWCRLGSRAELSQIKWLCVAVQKWARYHRVRRKSGYLRNWHPADKRKSENDIIYKDLMHKKCQFVFGKSPSLFLLKMSWRFQCCYPFGCIS